MLFRVAHRITSKRYRHAHLFVFFGGIALTLVLWRFMTETEDRAAQARFNQTSARYLLAIERGSSDSMDSVRTIRMLFRMLPDTSRQQFQDFAVPILSRYTHLKALVYIKEMSPAERSAVEARMKAEGFGHGIRDYDTQNNALIPAAAHDHYAVVRYAEPFAANAHLPGYNLMSRSGLTDLLHQARDSGDLVVTPLLRLAKGGNQAAPQGIIGYLPLFTGPDWLPSNVEERRKRLAGYAGVVVQTEQMFSRILEKAGYQGKDGIHLRIYDGDAANPDKLMFGRQSEPDGTVADAPATVKPLIRQISVGGRNWLLEAAPQSDARFLSRLASAAVLTGGLVATFLLTALFRFMMRYTAQVERQVDDRTSELTAAKLDLSEKNTLHEALAQAQSDMGDGIMIIQDRRFVYANDHLCSMLEHSPEELQSLPEFITVFEQAERSRILDRHMRRVNGEKLEKVYETRMTTRSHKVIDVLLAAVRVEWKGKPAAVVEVRDITERKTAQKRIMHLAHHDALTDLPNRALLQDRLEQAIALATRHHKQVGILYMDLDGFKRINDTYGHDTGDQLLVGVAERLKQCVRKTDTIARLGGDEFVVLLPDLLSPGDAIRVANKIIDSLADEVVLDNGVSIGISTSIGINMSPPGACNPEIMIKQADKAMYDAKHSGKNCFMLYSEEYLTGT